MDTFKIKEKEKEEYNTDTDNDNDNDIDNNNNNIKQIPEGEKLKIINWNVNGIRAFKSKGTLDKLIKEGIFKF